MHSVSSLTAYVILHTLQPAHLPMSESRIRFHCICDVAGLCGENMWQDEQLFTERLIATFNITFLTLVLNEMVLSIPSSALNTFDRDYRNKFFAEIKEIKMSVTAVLGSWGILKALTNVADSIIPAHHHQDDGQVVSKTSFKLRWRFPCKQHP